LHKLIKIALWMVFTTGVIVLLGFTDKKHKQTLCNVPTISIERPSEFAFLSENIVLELLENKGYTFTNQSIEDISAGEIERIIYSLTETENVDVFKSLNGDIHINITERLPILRVINQKGNSFYIDDKGKAMPLSPYYTANTHIATGNIAENPIAYMENVTEGNYEKTILNDLYIVTKEIVKDTFLNSQIVQIYVDERKEIILIPRIGEQKILIGKSNDIEDKFFRLKTFYQKGINANELNLYETLNLKYNKQIICSKR
jgi:cell division protein FtsQ